MKTNQKWNDTIGFLSSCEYIIIIVGTKKFMIRTY